MKQKQKSDEAAKRLQDEIQSIKAQKVDGFILINPFHGYNRLIYSWL